MIWQSPVTREYGASRLCAAISIGTVYNCAVDSSRVVAGNVRTIYNQALDPSRVMARNVAKVRV